MTINFSFSGYLHLFKTLKIIENHKIKGMWTVMKLNLLNFVFYVHLPCTKVETAGKVHMVQRDKSQPFGCMFNYPNGHKLYEQLI